MEVARYGIFVLNFGADVFKIPRDSFPARLRVSLVGVFDLSVYVVGVASWLFVLGRNSCLMQGDGHLGHGQGWGEISPALLPQTFDEGEGDGDGDGDGGQGDAKRARLLDGGGVVPGVEEYGAGELGEGYPGAGGHLSPSAGPQDPQQGGSGLAGEPAPAQELALPNMEDLIRFHHPNEDELAGMGFEEQFER